LSLPSEISLKIAATTDVSYESALEAKGLENDPRALLEMTRALLQERSLTKLAPGLCCPLQYHITYCKACVLDGIIAVNLRVETLISISVKGSVRICGWK